MILTCLALRLRLFLKGIESSSRADISLGQPSIHLRNERTASTSLISGKYSFAKSLRFTVKNIEILKYWKIEILIPLRSSAARIFLPHPSSPARRFSKITPVPSLPLKRGSTSPSAPSPQERAPTGKPAVLYSQTSSRPKGLLVITYAIELRLLWRNRVAIVWRNRIADLSTSPVLSC